MSTSADCIAKVDLSAQDLEDLERRVRDYQQRGVASSDAVASAAKDMIKELQKLRAGYEKQLADKGLTPPAPAKKIEGKIKLKPKAAEAPAAPQADNRDVLDAPKFSKSGGRKAAKVEVPTLAGLIAQVTEGRPDLAKLLARRDVAELLDLLDLQRQSDDHLFWNKQLAGADTDATLGGQVRRTRTASWVQVKGPKDVVNLRATAAQIEQANELADLLHHFFNEQLDGDWRNADRADALALEYGLHPYRFDGMSQEYREGDDAVWQLIFALADARDVAFANNDVAAGPEFSKADTTGSTVARVRTEIAKLKLADNGRVIVVQSVADLPAGARAAIEKESGTGGKVQGFVLGGRAYLVADNIAPGNARAVFMHEVGAHLGIDNLLTKAQYDNLVRKLLSWADKNDGSIESRIARRAVARAGQARTPDVDLHSEVLAYFVEEAVKAGIDPTALKYSSEIGRWFSELIRALKRALAKLQMFTAPDLTPQDVVDLAYGAAKLELEAPLAESPGGALLESRIVRDERGNREYEGADVRIAFPQEVERIEVIPVGGQRVLNYAIMPADSFGVLGHVDLLVDAHGVPESLLDIEVYERGRGAGESAVAALLNAYPDRSINISNIVPEAQGFWEKLGVPVQNLEEGAAYDGTLNSKTLEQAQRDRAQSTAKENPRDRRAADRAADPGAASGVRGTVQEVGGRARYSKAAEEIDTIREGLPAERRAVASRLTEWTNGIADAGWRGNYSRASGSRVGEAAKRTMFGFMTNFQLAEQFGDRIKALKERTGHVVAMIQRRGEMSQKVTAALVRWDALPQDLQNRLNLLMRDATMAEIHPDVAFDDASNKHLKPADREKYNQLHARYEALGPGKAVYQEAKAVLAEQWDARRKGYVRMVDNQMAELLAAANEGGRATDEKIAEIEKLGKELKARYNEQQGKVRGPYFPLLRFGNYLAIGESAELKAAQEELAGLSGKPLADARERVAQMKRDPKHYVVSAHDTRNEALAAVRSMRDRKLESRLSLKDPTEGQLSRETAGLLKQFQDSLRKKWGEGELDGEGLDSAMEAMTKVYLANLPEVHALKRQAERRGIAGASVDMKRAFASAGQQGAFMASRMEFADALATDMANIKAQAKADMAKTDDANAGHVANEMLRRQALDMTYTETPAQDWLTTAGYTYYLGASPAFLLMNLMQPGMVSVPVLAGRFGMAKAAVAMRRSYATASSLLKYARYRDDKRWDPWRSIEDAAKEDEKGEAKGPLAGNDKAHLRYALRQLMQRGVIDEGLQHELTAFSEGGNQTLVKAQKYIGWAGQQVEIVNRLSTALAAYELALEGKSPRNPDGTWTAEHDRAVEYAYSQTVRTQMDYSSESTARLMREGGGIPFAKMIFQFRRFQQGMLYLLADNVKTAFSADPAEAKAARATLGWLFATTGLMAGALGMPFVGMALWLASFGDDEDDPEGTTEVKLRNALVDTFGSELGTVLAKGLPAAFGADISKRVGLGDIASPFPMARLDDARTGKDAAKELLFNAAGPAFGMGASMWDGARHLIAGDLQEGVEKIVPKMFADVSRGVRFGVEGMTDSKGNPIQVPLDAGDVFLRSIGVSPVRESNYYEGTKALRDVQTGMNEVKGRIGQDYRAALRSGDFADVRKAIAEWNEKHPGQRIAAKDETGWRRQEMSARKSATPSGIKVDKAAKQYEGVARFAQP